MYRGFAYYAVDLTGFNTGCEIGARRGLQTRQPLMGRVEQESAELDAVINAPVVRPCAGVDKPQLGSELIRNSLGVTNQKRACGFQIHSAENAATLDLGRTRRWVF